MMLLSLVLALPIENAAAAACATTTYYQDTDADGYGVSTTTAVRCIRATGYTGWATVAGDCLDTNAAVSPGAVEVCNRRDDNCNAQIDETGGPGVPVWYLDADGDTYGSTTSVSACVRPTGYASVSGDCVDTSTAISPAAVETCNGIDDNCDGATDPSTSVGVGTWYADVDNDRFGNPAAPIQACTKPAGSQTNTLDCNDTSAAVSPLGREICNGIDDNCDGVTDPVTALGAPTWYQDADGDGYGVPGATTRACTVPSGYAAASTDCNDGSSAVSPGGVEICNGIDDNCDGTTDPASASGAPAWYTDADGDGYGNAAAAVTACARPPGTVASSADCNDGSATVSPAAVESCNGVDDDCDGVTDPSSSAGGSTWYADADSDGYGDAGSPVVACAQPSGTVADATDCNDDDPAVAPNSPETCNGLDDNCDGVVDPSEAIDATSWYADIDNDGYGDPGSILAPTCTAPAFASEVGTDCDDGSAAIYPGALDVCNGIDDDCDGVVDPTFEDGTWYADLDGDGHGDPALIIPATCGVPEGAVNVADDCDDSDAAVFPGAIEVCNEVDDDCDGVTDPMLDGVTWYTDTDADGYGDPETAVAAACDAPSDVVLLSGDCDDFDPLVSPAAEELCNDLDDDCDGAVDPAASLDAAPWYADLDGDTYGDPTRMFMACVQPDATVDNADDCNDYEVTISPVGVELCNGHDDDCDGVTDPSTSVDATVWYRDADHDGYGDVETGVSACAHILGTTTEHTDCDDADPTLHDECYTVAYGDLHTHSNLSQDGCEDETNDCLPLGFYPGEELYAHAYEQGMDFGAITDHAEHDRYQRPADGVDIDIWAWAQALVQEADGGPVIPIVGYEYTAAFGHRTVLFDANEVCPAYRKATTTSRTPKDVFGLEVYTGGTDDGYASSASFVAGMEAAATEVGCEPVRWISYYHHPAYKPPGEVKWSVPSVATAYTDTVVEIASEHGSSECYNLTWPGCDFRAQAKSYQANGSVQRALQLGYRLGFVGGSDNHQTDPALLLDGPGYIGHLYDIDGDGIDDSPNHQFTDGTITGVYVEGLLDRTAIFDAIDTRHTFATTWPFDGLKLHAVNTSGMVYLPGDDVPIAGGPLTLEIDLTDPIVSSWYAEIVNPNTGAVSTATTLDLSDGVPRYVRIRAWVNGVEQRLWASPFFPI